MSNFWLLVLFFLAAVPLIDVATPVAPWGDKKVKHTRNHIPVNWETLGHPSTDSTIDLNIVLKPDRGSALTDAVSEISYPRHSRYRAFLSKEQVDQLVRASPDTVVSAWLEHNGIRSSSISRTHGGTSLTISDLRVTQASELLGASYQLYRNMKTNETIIRAVGYSPPEVLHRHVQTAMPATCFSSMEVTVQTPQRRSFGPAPAHMQAGSMKLGAVEARQPPAEPIIVVPESLRSLYGTVEYVPSPAAYGAGQNSLAVVANRLPSQQDLTTFMDRYQEQDANGATFNIQIVDWIPPNLGELPDERSNVVVQYATAMAYPTPLFVFRIAQDEVAFAQLLHFLLGMEPVPRTIGISFNYFFEYNLPMPDAVHLCELLEQFGARGSSVLVASGDHGVGAPEDCDAFHVEFPSSCPWVTSVGGTQSMHSESMHPEIATPRSGGGFSSYFDRPDYQGDAVPEYLDEAEESIREYEGLYDLYGRGYPDISAQAFGCRIYLNGVASVASGTACAVSTAAGIISLLNDYMILTRLADEDPDDVPLGFLNPWIYSDEVLYLKGLNDIVYGSNPGCGTQGFPAKPGWDPVTGLGTLNFPVLLYLTKERQFLALPSSLVPTPS